jgi:hypothetical protein
MMPSDAVDESCTRFNRRRSVGVGFPDLLRLHRLVSSRKERVVFPAASRRRMSASGRPLPCLRSSSPVSVDGMGLSK